MRMTTSCESISAPKLEPNRDASLPTRAHDLIALPARGLLLGSLESQPSVILDRVPVYLYEGRSSPALTFCLLRVSHFPVNTLFTHLGSLFDGLLQVCELAIAGHLRFPRAAAAVVEVGFPEDGLEDCPPPRLLTLSLPPEELPPLDLVPLLPLPLLPPLLPPLPGGISGFSLSNQNASFFRAFCGRLLMALDVNLKLRA
mmetsp:Transcript_68662/g.217162  ORF Transcript_68662/g.217162 Transcript_68662/m.217162 type:complete len:200 (-) Transcript_68662:203-802(-)